MQTCKIILATSLIWFLVDVILLLYYADCRGAGCAGQKGDEGRGGPSADAFVHHASDNQPDVNINEQRRDEGDEDKGHEPSSSGVSDTYI